MNKQPLSIEIKNQILSLKADGTYMTDIAKTLGISEYKVRETLVEQGQETNRKYSLNQNYFKTITEESCYVAGFIAADGNITQGKAVRIRIHPKDIELLHYFNQCVASNSNILTERKDSNHPLVGILWTSKEMVKDLAENFNITENKTQTLQPPNLHQWEHQRAFILGYIDGNGCVSSMFSRGSLSFYGANALLQWIKRILDEQFPVVAKKKVPNVHRCWNRNSSQYHIVGYRADEILEDLIKVPVNKLSRKWELNPTYSIGGI